MKQNKAPDWHILDNGRTLSMILPQDVIKKVGK